MKDPRKNSKNPPNYKIARTVVAQKNLLKKKTTTSDNTTVAAKPKGYRRIPPNEKTKSTLQGALGTKQANKTKGVNMKMKMKKTVTKMSDKKRSTLKKIARKGLLEGAAEGAQAVINSQLKRPKNK
jgi:hypothetical protein